MSFWNIGNKIYTCSKHNYTGMIECVDCVRDLYYLRLENENISIKEFRKAYRILDMNGNELKKYKIVKREKNGKR